MSALRRWTDRDGNEWACMAYDHGPHCRRCQPVDEMLADLLDGVAEGQYEARQHPQTATFEFKLTQQGIARAEELLTTRPDLALMWGQLQARDAGEDTAGDE